MLNEKFWLAVAFFGFLLLIIKYAKPFVIKALDSKTKEIADNISSAQEMKKQAEKLLIEAEDCFEKAINSSKKLLADAEIESQKLISDSRKMAEDEVNKKTAAFLERIKTEEESVVREVKNKIINLTTKFLAESISKNSTETHHHQAIDKALDNYKKIIH